jgi:flavin reductase (DIM6/NTAB) family NADH-FMN oxidoreductase RutF
MSPEQRQGVGAALGRIGSGLYVVAAGTGAEQAAMLASWVQQAGFEPPLISLALKVGRPVERLLAAGAAFTVNVISTAAGGLLKRFAAGAGPGPDAFAGLEIERRGTGVAVLKEALAFLECTVVDRVRPGDHVVYFGQVHHGGLLTSGEPRVHVRENGFNY